MPGILQDRHAPRCQEFRRREIPAKSRQIHHLLMRSGGNFQSLQIDMALFGRLLSGFFGELAQRSASGHFLPSQSPAASDCLRFASGPSGVDELMTVYPKSGTRWHSVKIDLTCQMVGFLGQG